ncbi:hypothetical protein Tco_0989723 [Tanacetum coccineum]|uniref:Uncharacterized protein n=1 Tax=Tanacetum coccineum TaxID=301880 RepID=A0ABQ5EV41_9ASTR
MLIGFCEVLQEISKHKVPRVIGGFCFGDVHAKDMVVYVLRDSCGGCPTVVGAGNPCSYSVVPCFPIELDGLVPVYIPEPEHPEDLVPVEDEAPTPPLPPFFLSPRIRPPTLLLTAPKPGCEVGESSAAAAARQLGPTMARRIDYSSIDTVDVRSRESSEFYSRHHDAQKDRAVVRAEIEVLRRERLAYKQESMETRHALARSEAYNRALEAWVTVLETQARRHEWQRQDADDRATRHIMRIQALEAGARDDTLEDTGSSA